MITAKRINGDIAVVAQRVVDDLCPRLVLVDDHAILREGLRALLDLESDLEVVGEAGSCDEAIDLVAKLQPDVVITDLAMSGGAGLQLISRLRKVAPDVRVLVLTVHNSEEYIKAALTVGADGYVLKDSSRADLLQAIRSVSRGQLYLCASVSARVVSGFLGDREVLRDRDARPAASAQLLTDREREILTLVAQGLPNKRIAKQLALSVKTIEKHRSNFMRKLGLHNTAGITMFAICKGLMSPDGLALHLGARDR